MSEHNIAMWNIRGGHSPFKQLEIKNLIRQYSIQLIGICETKLNYEHTIAAQSIIMRNWVFDHNLEHASYGRILVLWNPKIFTLHKIASSDQYIHYSATNLHTSDCFCINYVYAQNNIYTRQNFLHTLPKISPNVPWLCLGDFNCMHLSYQRSGGAPLSLKDITPLAQAILLSNLQPMSRFGPIHTWSNRSRSGQFTLSKLDHAFLNNQAICL